MTDDYLALSEAAEYLGVSRVKMSKLAREGVVPYVTSQLDRRLKLISRDALDTLRSGPHRQRRSAGGTRPPQRNQPP